MQIETSPAPERLSSYSTRIETIQDWRKFQLRQIIASPYFDPIEQAHCAYILRSGEFSDFEIVELTLRRLMREINAGARHPMMLNSSQGIGGSSC